MGSLPFMSSLESAYARWLVFGFGVAASAVAVAAASYFAEKDDIYPFLRLPSDGFLSVSEIESVLSEFFKEQSDLVGISKVHIPHLLKCLLEASRLRAVAQVRRILQSDGASEEHIFASAKLIDEQIRDLTRPSVFLMTCDQFISVLDFDTNGLIPRSEIVRKFRMVTKVESDRDSYGWGSSTLF